MSALHMIMQKWKTELVFRDHTDMDAEHIQLRIVMLGRLCGAIIGENGNTINDIKMATSTEIRVQARAQRLPARITRPRSWPVLCAGNASGLHSTECYASHILRVRKVGFVGFTHARRRPAKCGCCAGA